MSNITDTKVIMYDSEEAAKYKEIELKGWVSSDGFYFGEDEHLARYKGCTHVKCECGASMEKMYTLCIDCRNRNKRKLYNEMPFKEWDGETPLYSNSADEFFYTIDEIEDYMEESMGHGDDTSLQLIICEPVYPFEINLSEIYSRILADDMDLPKVLVDAEKKLNQTIRDSKEILSWVPGKYRTEVI